MTPAQCSIELKNGAVSDKTEAHSSTKDSYITFNRYDNTNHNEVPIKT
jgi:hypothetical protein